MGYVSDWKEAEEQARRAQDANPDCTTKADCPAEWGHHLLECVAYRRERRRRLSEAAEAEEAE